MQPSKRSAAQSKGVPGSSWYCECTRVTCVVKAEKSEMPLFTAVHANAGNAVINFRDSRHWRWLTARRASAIAVMSLADEISENARAGCRGKGSSAKGS